MCLLTRWNWMCVSGTAAAVLQDEADEVGLGAGGADTTLRQRRAHVAVEPSGPFSIAVIYPRNANENSNGGRHDIRAHASEELGPVLCPAVDILSGEYLPAGDNRLSSLCIKACIITYTRLRYTGHTYMRKSHFYHAVMKYKLGNKIAPYHSEWYKYENSLEKFHIIPVFC